MANIKKNFTATLISVIFSVIISIIANMVGYHFSFMESLPGMLILAVLAMAGNILAWLIPSKKLSAVLWISILAILVASPISPVADFVLKSVDKVSFMSVVTPILAYAGVVVGKDWESFKKVGIKGVIVSIFVISGTFLISALMGDFFMGIF